MKDVEIGRAVIIEEDLIVGGFLSIGSGSVINGLVNAESSFLQVKKSLVVSPSPLVGMSNYIKTPGLQKYSLPRL